MRKILLLAVLLASGFCARAGGIFIECESFFDKGGWVLDQQFIDEMGSSYLLAHGMGKQVADASTTVNIPAEGLYTVWARTYNWTSPWSEKPGPGKFQIKIGKKILKPVLGSTGKCWEWQNAGQIRLKAGQTTLALHDLTGFEGRCDAVYLTSDGDVPPADMEAWRRQQLGLTDTPAASAKYDFVVVGGGISGMCAAVAAARQGLKVALVNDRPVLGGNNSAEIRVHLGGTIEVGPYPALGRMQREFGHSKKGNAQPAENYEDGKKQSWIESEPNVTLYASNRAVAVRKDGSKIDAVIIRNIETSEEILLEAPLFADCTGDGTVGYLAGADYRYGREGKAEFGESLAPDEPDNFVLGASVQWYSKETGKKCKFPVFDYGLNFSDASVQKVTMGEWTWETGMLHDMTTEFEYIRDYGMMVIYSNWSYLKNKLGMYPDRGLDWVAYISGKRESRRLMGDYIYKQDDIEKAVFHEDATFATTWSIDLHFPDPEITPYFPGEEFKTRTVHNRIYPAAVPYRCLYSRNVDNLFMAGRDISVTHVALGTTRVMRTCGMSGEVVGLAASVCKVRKTFPRNVYRYYFADLQKLMKKGAAVDGPLPDNQRFNEQKPLKQPRLLNPDAK